MLRRDLRLPLVLSVLFLCCGALTAEETQSNSFYEGPGVFSTRPSETKSLQTIDRFGPVGSGIEVVLETSKFWRRA